MHVGEVIAEELEVIKPRLRGWLHAGVAPVVLVAGIVLVVLAPTPASRWAAAIYSLSGVVLFVTSGLFHVGTWRPRAHGVLRRINHANIYLIIAGSYTPIAVLALEDPERRLLLIGVWTAAVLGVVFRVLWVDAPRLLYTSLYVLLGWSVVPFSGDLFRASTTAGVLVLVGGVLYTIGGLVYATKWPDPHPEWFGFHEVFHAFTIAAWACQYVAISVLTYQA
jgi:hemolysin III